MHIIWFVAFKRDSSRQVSLERDGSWKFVEQKLRKKKDSLRKSIQEPMSFGLFNTTQRITKATTATKQKFGFFWYFLSIFFSPIYNPFVPGSKNTKRKRGNKNLIGKRTKAGSLLFRLLGLRRTLSRLVCYICDASRSAVCRIDHHRLRMKPARVIAFLGYSLYIYTTVFILARFSASCNNNTNHRVLVDFVPTPARVSRCCCSLVLSLSLYYGDIGKEQRKKWSDHVIPFSGSRACGKI